MWACTFGGWLVCWQAKDQPIVYVNDRFLEHTKYLRSDILGINWCATLPSTLNPKP